MLAALKDSWYPWHYWGSWALGFNIHFKIHQITYVYSSIYYILSCIQSPCNKYRHWNKLKFAAVFNMQCFQTLRFSYSMSSYPTEILRGYRIVGYQVIKFRDFNEMSAFINQKWWKCILVALFLLLWHCLTHLTIQWILNHGLKQSLNCKVISLKKLWDILLHKS